MHPLVMLLVCAFVFPCAGCPCAGLSMHRLPQLFPCTGMFCPCAGFMRKGGLLRRLRCFPLFLLFFLCVFGVLWICLACAFCFFGLHFVNPVGPSLLCHAPKPSGRQCRNPLPPLFWSPLFPAPGLALCCPAHGCFNECVDSSLDS